MTTWNDLVGYIKQNHKIQKEDPGLISMVFEVADMRTQIVTVTRQTLGDGQEEWVEIESPIGSIDELDLRQALTEIGNVVCGGLGLIGDIVTVKHAAPLADMNTDEFVRPLTLVTLTADRIEKKLVGTDKF